MGRQVMDWRHDCRHYIQRGVLQVRAEGRVCYRGSERECGDTLIQRAPALWTVCIRYTEGYDWVRSFVERRVILFMIATKG